MRRSRTKRYPWLAKILMLRNFHGRLLNAKQLERLGALKLRVSYGAYFRGRTGPAVYEAGSVNGLHFADKGVRDRETPVVEATPVRMRQGDHPGPLLWLWLAGAGKTLNLKDLA